MTLSKLNAFSWTLQPSVSTPLYFGASGDNGPNTFVTTSDGAANGSTVISTNLAAYTSADYDAVGCWIRCTAATNTANVGVMRRIVSYADATGTATCWTFPAQVKSGDAFELYENPAPYVVEDTGATTTTVQDASRADTTGFWAGSALMGGPYLEAVRVSDFATSVHPLIVNSSATGVLSISGSLAASTSVGDLFDIWWHPEVFGGWPTDLEMTLVDRSKITGTLGIPAPVPGNRGGSLSIELAFRGPGASRKGDPAELDIPLRCVTSATSIGDLTAAAGGSTVLVSTGGTATAGQIYFSETGGDVFVAATVTGGTSIVPSPTLRRVITAGSTIIGMRRYSPAESLQYALHCQGWHGKEARQYLWGCVPNISFSGARGEFLKSTVSLQVGNWATVNKDHAATAFARAWRPITSTVTPHVIGRVRVNIGGTELEARSFSLDMGFQVQPKTNLAAPNETDGFAMLGDAPTGSVDIFMGSDSWAALESFMGGSEVTILIQSGTAAGAPGVFAFWCYKAVYTGHQIADDAGQVTVTLPFRTVEDATETTLKRWYLGIA